MNPVYVKVAGVDISSFVQWRDLHLVSVLTKEVSTLTFTVLMGIGETLPVIDIPEVGEAVTMNDPSGLVFGGTVTQVETTVSGKMLSAQVTCTDYSYLLDGTLVHKNYASMDPADIVADLVSTFAPGKGFNAAAHVQRGNFLVPSIKFNYQPLTKCLESLAKLIGWEWYVDPSKNVHFFLGDVEGGIGENGAAPIFVDQTGGEGGKDIRWNSLDVGVNLQNMQNSVYVIGGNYKKTFTVSNTPDTYKTDGVAQVFSVAYPYEVSKIQVTLAGAAQTVGTDGITDPSTVQVLYNDKNRNIKFTAGAPTTGQTIKVFGPAQVPIVAHASDAASVATYGEYQNVITDKKITTVPEAQARATAAVLQFGHPVTDVKVKTLVPGCAIGQAIYVNLPAFGVTTWLVIKRVEATVYAPGAAGKLLYSLECIGSDVVTYVDLMTMILQTEAAQTTVDDSTVNQNLELTPVETLFIDETLSASATAAATFTWDTSKWGAAVWG